MENWAPFWFDSNNAWGLAGTPEQWVAIRENWARHSVVEVAEHPDAIYDATSATFDNHAYVAPSFGFRPEHIGGTQTLREFFDAHGMSTEATPNVEVRRAAQEK